MIASYTTLKADSESNFIKVGGLYFKKLRYGIGDMFLDRSVVELHDILFKALPTEADFNLILNSDNKSNLEKSILAIKNKYKYI